MLKMLLPISLYQVLNVPLLLLILISTGNTAKLPQKTPDDVFLEATLLAENVKFLRKQAGVKTSWPSIELDEEGHDLHHVLQKATEILDKN